MGLETGTYISSLNASNPTTSDAKTEGDDHIRLLKATILTTFPNITGAVTPTHTELNYVDGVTSAIQTQLDAKLPKTGGSMSGVITFTDNAEGITFSQGTDYCDASATVSAVNLGPSTTSWQIFADGLAGSPVFSISSTGAATGSDFIISSDERLKTDVESLHDSGSIIDSLTGYRFKYLNGKQSVGFIAQDVKKVLPELVTENDSGFLGVSYAQVVAVLVEAVKDLRREVLEMKAQ